jgi:thioredoxin 1
MITIREIKNSSDLDDFYALNGEELHILKIGAPWCGPCRQLETVLHGLEENKIGNTLVASVNIDADETEDIAIKYGVRAIPLTLFVKNGEVLERIQGAMTASDVYKKIEGYM